MEIGFETAFSYVEIRTPILILRLMPIPIQICPDIRPGVPRGKVRNLQAAHVKKPTSDVKSANSPPIDKHKERSRMLFVGDKSRHDNSGGFCPVQEAELNDEQ